MKGTRYGLSLRFEELLPALGVTDITDSETIEKKGELEAALPWTKSLHNENKLKC